MNMKLKFFTLFIILAIVTTIFINKYHQNNQQERLQQATKTYTRTYDTAYETKHQLSKVLFSGLQKMGKLPQRLDALQTATKEQKDKIREEMYEDLKFRFSKLKHMGMSQLHIHLPNNESFLRMHKPDKYGDNLTTIRPSVALTNQNYKAYDGIEVGKVNSGLRFVYPIFYKNMHVGSMEISYQISELTASIMRQYYVLSNFFIKEDPIKVKQFKGMTNSYYKPSHHKGYYYDKRVLKELKKVSRKDMKKLKPEQNTIHKIREMGQKDTPSSLYHKSTHFIFTIIPIVNKITKKNIGFLTIRSKANFSTNQIYFTYALSIGFLALAIYLLYGIVSKKDELEQIIQEKTQQLSDINKNLEQRIDEEVEKNRLQNQQMQQQSRLAQMGEMISMIAHQWRQPLNAISLTSSNLKFKCMMDDYDKDIFEKEIDLIDEYSQHLSKTIDDFRGFFKENKEKEETSLKDIVNSTLDIVKTSVETQGITINTDLQCDEKFETYPNEIKQVVLNLIKNADDVLLENEI
ncbi:MAG: cache domain-containing protein, partial [Campylobacterota bacterium]|nr:cache domain-containing protein [Campylobacterota bacterium]